MTVREFGAGDIVQCATTGLTDALANGWSAFGVIKRTTEGDYVNLIGFDATGNHRGGLWLTDTGLLQAVGSGLDTTIALDVPLDTWVYIGIDVPDGDGVTVRGHLKSLSGGSMSHANSSGTVNEETSATNGVTLGNNENDFPLHGRIAALGFRKGGTLWGDAQHETNAAGIQEWIDGGATNVWPFQQTGTPPAIIEDAVGSSDQTNQGSDGTTAITGDDPPNFDLTVGGAIDLVVQGATQAQSVDSPTLTQVHVLAVDGATQAQSVDSPALTQQHALTAQDATQGQSADEPTLTQQHALIVDSATQAQSVDSPTLNTAVDLTVDDASQAQSVDSPALTQQHALIVAGATQAQSVDSPALTQAHLLAVQSATQAQQVDTITLVVLDLLTRGAREVIIDGQAKRVVVDAQQQRVQVTSQTNRVSV